MRIIIPTLVLALASILPANAANKIIIEPVQLTKTLPFRWVGKNDETIDACLIDTPVSIVLSHCTNVMISAGDLRSIELNDCDSVTVRNCWLHDSAHCGVQLWNCRNMLIQGCRFENVPSGVYALNTQHIRVIGNFMRNMQGPFPRGQAVQFDKVTGADNVIRGNYAINDCHKSRPEDDLSIYMCHGEETSPLLVENNYLTGDPTEGSTDKSKSGSGIMLGDSGGAYITCRSNVIISAGQVGIGVAGGSFIRVENNIIYGRKSNVSNVGLSVWNQTKLPSDHVMLIGNRVQWLNQDGKENSWWNGGNTQDVEEKDNRFADPTLASNLPAPPSRAPMPPQPRASLDANGTRVVRLPWKQDD
jgi:hypothetical protein